MSCLKVWDGASGFAAECGMLACRAAHRIWAATWEVLISSLKCPAELLPAATLAQQVQKWGVSQWYRAVADNKNHLLTGGRYLASSLILFFSLRLDFIYDLFERVCSRCSEETLKMGTQRRRPTVSSQFRVWCFPREQQASGEEQMGKARPAAKRSHSSLFCVQHWKCAGMLQC